RGTPTPSTSPSTSGAAPRRRSELGKATIISPARADRPRATRPPDSRATAAAVTPVTAPAAAISVTITRAPAISQPGARVAIKAVMASVTPTPAAGLSPRAATTTVTDTAQTRGRLRLRRPGRAATPARRAA